MFLGINMFLALLKLILTLAALGLKWVWVGPKTYLCPRTSTLLLYYRVRRYNSHQLVSKFALHSSKAAGIVLVWLEHK